jgi:predicted AlkP superfamily pyrophosphatase or phosphodiesterase
LQAPHDKGFAMQYCSKLFTALAVSLVCGNLLAAGRATHVILVVWDGMRPDFVTDQTTPTLAALARQGVLFRNHHSAYVTSTEVNGAVLATGVCPGENGIVGNREFRPAINPTRMFVTADLPAVRRGDELTHNHFLHAATVAEQLHRHGLHTAIAGAKPVTLLHDRLPRAENALDFTLFEGHTLPEGLETRLESALGKFPPAAVPKTARDHWTTEALLGPLWQHGPPAFSVLWLSEPDNTQHETGPSSETSLAALRSADDCLARQLAALDKLHLREQTDLFIVSDHGFSTMLASFSARQARDLI